MDDFKLNFRQLNLLMGIIGLNMIKFRIAATAKSPDLSVISGDFIHIIGYFIEDFFSSHPQVFKLFFRNII